jgi:hypothetical protein
MALFIGNNGKDRCTHSTNDKNPYHLALPAD